MSLKRLWSSGFFSSGFFSNSATSMRQLFPHLAATWAQAELRIRKKHSKDIYKTISQEIYGNTMKYCQIKKNITVIWHIHVLPSSLIPFIFLFCFGLSLKPIGPWAAHRASTKTAGAPATAINTMLLGTELVKLWNAEFCWFVWHLNKRFCNLWLCMADGWQNRFLWVFGSWIFG